MFKVPDIKNRILSSKDGKVLFANFGYLSLLQIAGYIFPLITIPYLARVIGVEGFGKIAFASSVIIWFQTIADWGFNYTATRDVAKNRDDIARVTKIFSSVFWARCILMIGSLIILLLLILLIPIFKENTAVILVTFLMIPGYIMFPDWLFQAMERMKYITMLNIMSKALFTVAVFLFVRDKSDYLLQPLLVSCGYILSGVVAFYYIRRIWGIKLKKVSFNEIFETINNSSDVFLNNLMPNLYNSFSTMLLGIVGGPSSNGLYDAGCKFINIAQQFMQVISRTFFPFLSRKIEKHHLYVVINIVFAVMASMMLFILSPVLIKLFFTSEFFPAIKVMRIMSISIFFLMLSDVYGTNYLIINGSERILRNVTIICSLIGFALSFPLIHCYDYIGAALTVTITRGMLGICSMFFAKRSAYGKLVK